MVEADIPESPKSVLKTITNINNMPRLSNEDTAVTPIKAPSQAAAIGKKWAKIKKTEQSTDAKGYMCFKDVEVWEEVDDVKPAKKAAKKKEVEKQSVGQKQSAAQTKEAQAPKVQ